MTLLLCATGGGCFLFGGSGRERASVASNNPGSKIPAIKHAADARDTETARHLVKSLESDDPAVRFYAIRGLQGMTGETFGYVWYEDGEAERRPSVEKWKKWLDANGSDQGALAGGGGHNRK